MVLNICIYNFSAKKKKNDVIIKTFKKNPYIIINGIKCIGNTIFKSMNAWKRGLDRALAPYYLKNTLPFTVILEISIL